MARRLFLLLLATALLAPAAIAEPAPSAPLRLSFEETEIDALPDGWRVEATSRHGLLATWGVIAEETAPSGSRVLAMRQPNHSDDGTFNCRTGAASGSRAVSSYEPLPANPRDC